MPSQEGTARPGLRDQAVPPGPAQPSEHRSAQHLLLEAPLPPTPRWCEAADTNFALVIKAQKLGTELMGERGF